jgi:hypothetical protein
MMASESERLDQLAEGLRQVAAAQQAERAQSVGWQARLAVLESHVEGSRAALAATAERVERLAGQLDVSPQLGALSAQLEATRAAQSRLADRMEHVTAQLGQLARLEDALTHIRNEVVGQIGEREAALRTELRGFGEIIARDREANGRALAGLVERLEALGALADRVAVAESRLGSTSDAAARAFARAEEVASERVAIEDAVRLAEQKSEARLAALAVTIEDLASEVATWRARIDAQTEAVREARGVADTMSLRARELLDAHHATAEAQRIAEGRVDASLAAMREDVRGHWDRFLQQRKVDWSELARARDLRGEEIAAQAAAVAARLADIDAALGRIDGRLIALAEADAAQRRTVAEAMSVWRTALVEATDIVEAELPPEQRTALAGERREAVRRDLRTRRETRGA